MLVSWRTYTSLGAVIATIGLTADVTRLITLGPSRTQDILYERKQGTRPRLHGDPSQEGQ